MMNFFIRLRQLGLLKLAACTRMSCLYCLVLPDEKRECVPSYNAICRFHPKAPSYPDLMVEWSSRSFDESVLMNFFQQVAAFRATLEMPERLLLVNVVGIRIDEVDKVLSELDVSSIPRLMVWNKVDRVSDVKKLKLKQRENKMLSRICFE